MLNKRPVKIDNGEDLTSQFILNTQLKATLCIGTCNLSSGGCYAFGNNLADELKCDYLGVQIVESVRPKKINVITEKMELKQYQNIIITGCFFDNHLPLLETQKKYSLSQLKNIYALAPPSIIIENNEYKNELQAISKEYSRVSSTGKVILLTSGMEKNTNHCIGLPNPCPQLSLINEKKLNVENCYGLIYIRNLTDYNAFKPTHTTDYLSAYFSQVFELSKKKSIENSSVIAIVDNNKEVSIIQQEAKKYNINIVASNRIPSEDYVLVLKTIGANGGFIACNGHSAIQAVLLKCNLLYYADREINIPLAKQLVEFMPKELQKLAEVILGLSNNYDLLKNTTDIEKVRVILETTMQESHNKFKQIKQYGISVSSELNSPTNDSTVENERKHTFNSF